MERRAGSRVDVSFVVSALVDGQRHPCRAVNLSPTGMVFEATENLATRTMPQMSAFELHIANGRPIRTRARTVWTRDRLRAVRFVVMNDVDRLTIAEHLDRVTRGPAN